MSTLISSLSRLMLTKHIFMDERLSHSMRWNLCYTNPIFELGIFDSVIDLSSSRTMLIWNCAFLSGRSKHGNARLASIGENCVLASHLEKENHKTIPFGTIIRKTKNHFSLFFYGFCTNTLSSQLRCDCKKHFKIITSFLGSFHPCRTIDKILVKCPLACWWNSIVFVALYFYRFYRCPVWCQW